MIKIILSVSLLFLLSTNIVFAQSQTVGLLQNDSNSFAGYTLFAKSRTTYLINTAGEVVHNWDNNSNSMHPGYLMANGDLFVVGQGVKRLNWDGDLIWQYINPQAHHDIAILPNENVLLLISGSKTNSEVIDAGRNPTQVTDNLEPMVIYEINSNGDVVWEWHVWDHLIQDFDSNKENFGIVENHPEWVDLNFSRGPGADWLHGNAIDYNPELDQILISPRFNSEVWIIDHSTTTAQAASHSGGNSGQGGDLLYRWGNPIAYGAGTANDQQLYGSHDSQWIKSGLPGAGNIMVFNNGGTAYGRDGNYSTIDEFTPPVNGYNYDITLGGAYAPTSTTWNYTASPRENFYSSFISGVQRLENGHTFIDEGEDGLLFEITDAGETVWKYQNPVTNSGHIFQSQPVPAAPGASLFRSYKFSTDFIQNIGETLTPTDTVELYNNYSNLTVQSNIPGLITYPGEGAFSFGIGQLMTLSAQQDYPYEFIDWSVISGSAILEDANSLHTTFTVSDSDSIIQANFQINTDIIYLNGFE